MQEVPIHLRPYIVTNQEWAELIKRQDATNEAVFGGWNADTKKRSPGLLEKLDTQTWILRIISVFAFVSMLKAFGVPTQEILPMLLKVVATTSGG